jgi:hypothetical protein
VVSGVRWPRGGTHGALRRWWVEWRPRWTRCQGRRLPRGGGREQSCSAALGFAPSRPARATRVSCHIDFVFVLSCCITTGLRNKNSLWFKYWGNKSCGSAAFYALVLITPKILCDHFKVLAISVSSSLSISPEEFSWWVEHINFYNILKACWIS